MPIPFFQSHGMESSVRVQENEEIKLRDYPFSAYAKCSEKLTCAYLGVRKRKNTGKKGKRIQDTLQQLKITAATMCLVGFKK